MRLQKYIQEAAYRLPTMDRNEIGLMTKEEFLKHRNPEDKFHASDSYDFDKTSLNIDYKVWQAGKLKNTNGDEFTLFNTTKKGNYIIEKNNRMVAVLYNGTMYHTIFVTKGELPDVYYSPRQERIELNIKNYTRVKYLTDALKLVSNVIAKNYKQNPVLVGRIKNFEGEYYEIRAEKKLVKNKGVNMVMLNSKGEVVAIAQNEWGATLIVVAKEYRGKGLAKKITKVWYEWNPEIKSGGMTQAGRHMAIGMWEDRVKDFLSQGWYDTLLKKKKITMDRIKEILSGLSKKTVYKPIKKKSTKEEPLFLVEDSVFVIYDKSFYDIDDYYTYDGKVEKTIYATGLIRNSGTKTFIYSIDYEPKYRKTATEVALQMGRDQGEKFYYSNGNDYGDVLELNGIKNLKKEGNNIYLTKDILPLKRLSAIEKKYRKERDQYDELYTIILETADSKWK